MTHAPDPEAFFQGTLARIEARKPFVVATVLKAEGSTPVKPGAKAIIEADGTIDGTVGGGAVEAEAQRQASLVARSGKPVLFDFDLAGSSLGDSLPVCGGAMRLLVAPASVVCEGSCRQAAAALARHEQGIWLTTLRSAPELKVETRFIAEAEFTGFCGYPAPDILRAILTYEEPSLLVSPATAASASVEVFAEPIVANPLLVIVGGGHVAQAVAAQARLVGFRIAIIEDRPEFCSLGLFPPGTTTRCGGVAEEAAALTADHHTFVAIVTRGHQQDSLALRACVGRPFAYIGMIGSRRKIPLMRQQFLAQGWATADAFDRVYAPIGLEIGAATVPEIAASIVAQLISVRRRGSATKMPWK